MQFIPKQNDRNVKCKMATAFLILFSVVILTTISEHLHHSSASQALCNLQCRVLQNLCNISKKSRSYQTTVLCKLVVSLRMQKRKTTDKIALFQTYLMILVLFLAGERALHLHFATDKQLAKPCNHNHLSKILQNHVPSSPARLRLG